VLYATLTNIKNRQTPFKIKKERRRNKKRKNEK
jgi:hypothetical protein